MSKTLGGGTATKRGPAAGIPGGEYTSRNTNPGGKVEGPAADTIGTTEPAGEGEKEKLLDTDTISPFLSIERFLELALESSLALCFR